MIIPIIFNLMQNIQQTQKVNFCTCDLCILLFPSALPLSNCLPHSFANCYHFHIVCSECPHLFTSVRQTINILNRKTTIEFCSVKNIHIQFDKSLVLFLLSICYMCNRVRFVAHGKCWCLLGSCSDLWFSIDCYFCKM